MSFFVRKEAAKFRGDAFVADASVVRCELLAQSLTLTGADGSKRIVQLFDMSLSMVTRRGVGAEKEAEIKKRFTRCFYSNRDLKTVTRPRSLRGVREPNHEGSPNLHELIDRHALILLRTPLALFPRPEHQ